MAEAEYWRFTVARDCQKKNTSENHSECRLTGTYGALAWHAGRHTSDIGKEGRGANIAMSALLPILVEAAAAASATTCCAAAVFEPLLFMDMEDVHDSWGLIWPAANSVSPNASYHPPPLDFAAGALVIAVIASASQPGTFEVYGENTTGWEPLLLHRQTAGRSDGQHECTLLRYTTTDFVEYSAPHVALQLPSCSGTPTLKSIARSPDGLYVMFTVFGGYETFTSQDAGMSWQRANTTGVISPDKDDLNIIYNKGRFVDMQIVWQNHTQKYSVCPYLLRTQR
jgi:hypothetical protein